MDLEMHVVHEIDPEIVEKSQFTNGVLGFLFKAVKDDYFKENDIDDFHDKFLNDMLDDQK